MLSGAIAALVIACGAAPSEEPLVTRGRGLFSQLGCAACHAVDARPDAPKVGPSLARLYGTEVTLSDGRVLLADDAYLTESIAEPDAKTVAGYERGVMVAGLGSTRERLSDPGVIEALVAYLRSLR